MSRWIGLVFLVACDSPFGMNRPHEGEPCSRPDQCGESGNACQPNVCIYGFCDGAVVIDNGVLVRNDDGDIRECSDGRVVGISQPPACPDCKGPYELCEDHSECLSNSCAKSYAACGGNLCCAQTAAGHVDEYDD